MGAGSNLTPMLPDIPVDAESPQDEFEIRARSRLGTVLRDKYRLDYILGHGGAATVYAATHRNGKRVALKLLHPELAAEPSLRERFLREGNVANKVNHPGVVAVIDDDTTDAGWPFLVMELLQGLTVHTLWESWGFRLPPALVTAIGIQLLDVISAAHASGVIHRDLKPENVFLTPEGEVKVLDFGIARLRDAGGFKTNLGTVMGTPAFMAPEQAASLDKLIDGRTDVWAIGSIAFALLVGDVVHPAETAQQTLILAATARARSLRELVPQAPVEVVAAFERALEFKRDDRWGSAAEMRDALALASEAAFGTSLGAHLIRGAMQGLVSPLREVAPFEAQRTRTPPEKPPEPARASAPQPATSAVAYAPTLELPKDGPQLGRPNRIIGRYAIYEPIAAGGMATVYLGRLLGAVGFSRTVAIKCLHTQFAADPSFVAMFTDEARLAARINHANVVQTLDIVNANGELFLVMDYVRGASLARLLRGANPVPLPIVVAVIAGVLRGLDAAHEAKSERGEPLSIVHRDVSPQNIMVGNDGVPRLLDFGVAKAVGRLQKTGDGELKGKLSYMAPEQLMNERVGREADIYAAGVVLWESIARRVLFHADSEGAIVKMIVFGNYSPASAHRPPSRDETRAELSAIDDVVRHALARKPEDRFPTAAAMAAALEAVVPPASPTQVAAWVRGVAGDELDAQARLVASVEGDSARMRLPSVRPLPWGGAAAEVPMIPRMPDAPRIDPSSGFGAPGRLETVEQPGGQPTVADDASRRAPTVVRPRSSVPEYVVPRAPSMLVWGVGVGAALLLVGLGVAGVIGRGASAASAAPSASVVAAPVAAAPVAAPSVAAAEPAVPSVPVPPTPTPEAPIQSAKRPSATKARPPTGPATPARPAADCDPPYVYDAQGHKHYKPECPL
jgi:serine/threonine-protein kinase